MGRSTGIAWTRSTRNFWSGCTKVGPGCDGCYAEAFNRFTRGKNETTGQAMNWGPGAPRIEHLRGAMKEEYQGADCRLRLVDRAGGDPTEWPEDLRVQEFPA